ncbi:hypothetical protein V1506DRAFT_130766 [Lipomyces tetrasporus]
MDRGPAPLRPSPRESSPTMAPGLPDGTELERLKKAVDVKIALPQQRANLAIRSSPNRTPSMCSNRICPIQEERTVNTTSPTLEADFASSPTAGTTESSDSTASTESGKTIRGSVASHARRAADNPPAKPLRTPSYPFPYIPGTTKPFTPGLHQSFTTLSPTLAESIGLTSRESTVSESSTPQPGRHIDKILEDLDQMDIKAG